MSKISRNQLMNFMKIINTFTRLYPKMIKTCSFGLKRVVLQYCLNRTVILFFRKIFERIIVTEGLIISVIFITIIVFVVSFCKYFYKFSVSDYNHGNN